MIYSCYEAFSETEKQYFEQNKRRFLGMIGSLLVQAPEGFEDVIENFSSLIYGVVLPIIFIVLGAVFVVIGVIRAAHISTADNEDSKKKAVKAMIWFVIGGVLCFVVAFTVPVLFNYLSSTFPVPTG